MSCRMQRRREHWRAQWVEAAYLSACRCRRVRRDAVSEANLRGFGYES
jgi:hypothetical protein